MFYITDTYISKTTMEKDAKIINNDFFYIVLVRKLFFFKKASENKLFNLILRNVSDKDT